VIIDATAGSSLSYQENWSVCANNLPAPSDRRRLPVNRDIVGMDKGASLSTTAQKVVIHGWMDAVAQSLFQSETALMAHMRSARDLRMMIPNVNNVFYSK
jgi:hypothetical protein